MNLLYKSLQEVRSLLHSGEISPLALINKTYERIHAKSNLNAFITLSEESSFALAQESAQRIGKKNILTLDGIPIAVKDVFCTNNVRTTAGSKMLENFVPKYESSVTEKLLKAGAINVGKTNMDEYAMGSSNKTSYFGLVRNPWNLEYVPGGSSGGSAAAVADYLCYAALGSDTGGSVRQPASLCGVVGLKPSYGRCSRFGMIAYSSSLDQAGVFARTVNDACIVLEQIAGHCTRDLTTVRTKTLSLSNISGSVKNKRIGYVVDYIDKVEPDVKEAWLKTIDMLKNKGAEVFEIKLSEISDGEHDPIRQWTSVYYGFTTVEAFSNLCRYDGIRYGTYCETNNLEESYRKTRDNFGDEVKRRMLVGAYILCNRDQKNIYSRAVTYRHFIKSQFLKLFNRMDAILSPTSPHTAFKLDYQKSAIEMYLEDMFTVIANLIGSPAISIPYGLDSNGLPIGMQIMCEPFAESKMIEIAKCLETEFAFKLLHEVQK